MIKDLINKFIVYLQSRNKPENDIVQIRNGEGEIITLVYGDIITVYKEKDLEDLK